MLLQQSQELLLKGHLAMMLFLVADVSNGFVEQRHADAKGALFYLPPEKLVLGKCVMHPFGRTAFYELQGFGNRESRRQRQQHMRVVWHAAYFQSFHLMLAGDPAHKWPETFAQVRRY